MAGKLNFDNNDILNTFPTENEENDENLVLSNLVLNPKMCTKEAQRRISESRRFSISGGDSEESTEYKKIVIPHSQEELSRIRTAFSSTYFFSGLNELQRRILFDACREVDVEAGEIVIAQGQSADELFIIESGVYEVYLNLSSADEEKVNEYQNSGCFGDLALLYSTPRTATVLCKKEGIIWALEKTTFRHVVVRAQSERRRTMSKALIKMPLFAGLTEIQVHKVSDVCEVVAFGEDEYVIREGDRGDKFYIVSQGSCIATSDYHGHEVEIGRMMPGHYFGERALLLNQPRRANIKVVSNHLLCYRIDKQTFYRLIREFDLTNSLMKQIESYAKPGPNSPVLQSPAATEHKEEDDGFDDDEFGDGFS